MRIRNTASHSCITWSCRSSKAIGYLLPISWAKTIEISLMIRIVSITRFNGSLSPSTARARWSSMRHACLNPSRMLYSSSLPWALSVRQSSSKEETLKRPTISLKSAYALITTRSPSFTSKLFSICPTHRPWTWTRSSLRSESWWCQISWSLMSAPALVWTSQLSSESSNLKSPWVVIIKLLPCTQSF